ncbi:hypothetical protein AB0J43_57160, partial [Nonomuraea fuscirosea]
LAAKYHIPLNRAHILGHDNVPGTTPPTGALDSVSGAGVMELLHELNAGGTTILIITHDREIAAGLPRQVRMRDGEIVSDSAAGSEPLEGLSEESVSSESGSFRSKSSGSVSSGSVESGVA